MVNLGFWEKVLQPAVGNLIVLGGIAGTLGRRGRQVRMAAGAFLLLRARTYRGAGGHRAIRDQLVDDVALATNVFRRGGETVTMIAPGHLSVRMYRGLREIWRGWVKNMFAGHMDSLAWAAFTGSGLLISSVAPPLLAAAAFPAGAPELGIAFLAITAVAMAYRAVANVMVGERAWPVLFHPLAAAVICAILAHSTWQRRFGKGAHWRGRRYPLRG
jgi:chlorobactene glucosyltransferase